MIHRRHPAVADTVITHLSEPNDFRHFLGASTSREELRAVGFAAPDWRSLATALPRRLAVRLPGVLGIPDEGWQHDASSFVERHFLDSSVWPLLGSSERPMLRSQGGPLSGLPFMALPVTPLSRSTPTCSVFFSCGVCAFLSLCLLALAGVAVHSTALAITAQKLLEGGGAWETWLCAGICSCTDVPRSWSTSLNERLLA